MLGHRTENEWFFHTGHTAILCQVSGKTIYRWRKEKLIEFKRDSMNKQCLHSLSEINRIRESKILDIILPNEALELIRKENQNDFTYSG